MDSYCPCGLWSVGTSWGQNTYSDQLHCHLKAVASNNEDASTSHASVSHSFLKSLLSKLLFQPSPRQMFHRRSFPNSLRKGSVVSILFLCLSCRPDFQVTQTRVQNGSKFSSTSSVSDERED